MDLGAELEDFVIRIIDKRGAVVYHAEIERSGILNIDLSTFTYGNYQLEITQGNKRIVKPFVKM